MDKLVKKEVITLYASQVGIIFVALACAIFPIFKYFSLLKSWKAIAGLFVIACIVGLNVWFIIKRFLRNYAVLPAKFALESMNQAFFKIKENCEKGYFSKEETEQCKQRFVRTMDWLGVIDHFSLPFMIFDCTAMFLIVGCVFVKQILQHQFCFFTMYAVAGFFIAMQTA
ncbi:MAG: hypothetical protein IJ191_00995 [Treponema sp.]|nr:hypothetical protein [Treponema sp.]